MGQKMKVAVFLGLLVVCSGTWTMELRPTVRYAAMDILQVLRNSGPSDAPPAYLPRPTPAVALAICACIFFVGLVVHFVLKAFRTPEAAEDDDGNSDRAA